MKKLHDQVLLCIAVGALCLSAGAAAATPTTLHYVGELRAQNGLPYDGAVSIQVALYDAAQAGQAVRAAEDLGDVLAERGRIELEIGATGEPLLPVLRAHDSLWLELVIDGVVLEPRQRLGATPFAVQVGDVSHLGAEPPSSFVTSSEFDARLPIAAVGAAPPAEPAAGTLWWDPADQNLHIWDGGAQDWVPVSATEVVAQDLPPDGLGEASNQALSNEFEGVQHQWTTGAPIADATALAPGQPALAVVDVVEAPGSFLYAIEVQTHFVLTSANDVEMVLYPPPGSGVAPITLRSGLLTFGPYGDIWTVQNTPALADLLGTNPVGEWTLAVVDRDDNLANPGVAGSLESFTVVYNVVRSDHLVAAGELDVDLLRIEGVLSADLVTGELTVASHVDTTGEWVRRVQYLTYASAATDSSGIRREMPFTKLYDDSVLRIHWNDLARISTTSATRYYEIRVNGQQCNHPHNLRTDNRSHTSSGHSYTISQIDFVAYCNRVANIAPVPDVNDGINIPAGEYTIGVWQNSSNMQIGTSNGYGSLTVEEVFPAP